MLKVYTALSSKVGTHTVTVTIGLVNYASVTTPLAAFTLTINPCIVTAVKIVQSGTTNSLTDKSYTLSST